MALNRLCTAFRQIVTTKQSNIVRGYCSSHILKRQNNDFAFHNYSKNVSLVALPEVHIKFVPRTLNIDFGNPDNTTRNSINEIPLSKYIPSMEEPLTGKPVQQDLPLTDKSFQLPSTENNFEKLAVRLIIIRRKKMKKHKRKKFRKRMQFLWIKVRAKRNALKEKAFQAELISKIREAELFDAKKYVDERVAHLDEELVPMTYKGEIISREMIKEFMKKDAEKYEQRINKPRLKLD